MAGKSIADKIKSIKERLPKEVALIAVSKFHSTDLVRQAVDAGQTEFGENYTQEAIEKMEAIKDLKINWHFIGKIQSNKIKSLVGPFTLIQSVERIDSVRKISETAKAKGIVQKILIQVNVGDEATKSGVSLSDLVSFYETAAKERGVSVCGLMCLPPLESDISTKKKYFQQMKAAFDEIKKLSDKNFNILSMGTSHDFELAIEEGSNMVRIGTDIFGERTRK